MSSSAPTNKNVSKTPFVRTMNPALNSYTMSYNPIYFKKGDEVKINPIDRTVYIDWNRNFNPYTPQYPEGMDPVTGSESEKVWDGTTWIRKPIYGVIHTDETPDEKIIIKVNNIFVHIPHELKDKIKHASLTINELYTSSPGEYDYINRRLNTIKEILIENINNQTFSNSTMSDIRRIMAMNSKLLSSINKINNEDLLQLLKKLSPKSREEIDNKIYSKTIGDQKYSKIYRNQALKEAYKAEEMKNIPKIGGRRTRKRSKKTRKTRRHHR